jgi:hypothetical protein
VDWSVRVGMERHEAVSFLCGRDHGGKLASGRTTLGLLCMFLHMWNFGEMVDSDACDVYMPDVNVRLVEEEYDEHFSSILGSTIPFNESIVAAPWVACKSSVCSGKGQGDGVLLGGVPVMHMYSSRLHLGKDSGVVFRLPSMSNFCLSLSDGRVVSHCGIFHNVSEFLSCVVGNSIGGQEDGGDGDSCDMFLAFLSHVDSVLKVMDCQSLEESARLLGGNVCHPCYVPGDYCSCYRWVAYLLQKNCKLRVGMVDGARRCYYSLCLLSGRNFSTFRVVEGQASSVTADSCVFKDVSIAVACPST